MEYSAYIQNDNARREREIQLANQYNQKPEGKRVQNLWLHSVKKQPQRMITGRQIIEVIAGLIIVTLIILASIWL